MCSPCCWRRTSCQPTSSRCVNRGLPAITGPYAGAAMPRPAVVLLSGGLDSATVAAMARRDGFAVHALSFAYGQRHDIELVAAERVAAHVGAAEHRVIEI